VTLLKNQALLVTRIRYGFVSKQAVEEKEVNPVRKELIMFFMCRKCSRYD